MASNVNELRVSAQVENLMSDLADCNSRLAATVTQTQQVKGRLNSLLDTYAVPVALVSAKVENSPNSPLWKSLSEKIEIVTDQFVENLNRAKTMILASSAIDEHGTQAVTNALNSI